MSNPYEGNYRYGSSPASSSNNEAYGYNADSSAVKQPSQHSQYTQQNFQQPEQSHGNFWNPTTAMSAAAAFTSSDQTAMFNVAESMGKQFLETGWAKAVPGLERSMLALRPYFAVDNRYVKGKMGRVLFPFLCKDWARLVSMFFLQF